MDLNEWARTVTPDEFVKTGYKVLTGPTPKEIHAALTVIVERVKSGKEPELEKAFGFIANTQWHDAVGRPEEHAIAEAFVNEHWEG